jgi:hypothetical protein
MPELDPPIPTPQPPVELPPTGFEITEDEFNDFTAALMLKVREDGRNPGDTADINRTLRRWWKLLIDLPAAKRIDNEDQLARLKEERDEQDAGRRDMDAEITRLEAETR